MNKCTEDDVDIRKMCKGSWYDGVCAKSQFLALADGFEKLNVKIDGTSYGWVDAPGGLSQCYERCYNENCHAFESRPAENDRNLLQCNMYSLVSSSETNEDEASSSTIFFRRGEGNVVNSSPSTEESLDSSDKLPSFKDCFQEMEGMIPLTIDPDGTKTKDHDSVVYPSYKSVDDCSRECAVDSKCTGFVYDNSSHKVPICVKIFHTYDAENLEPSLKSSYIKTSCAKKGFKVFVPPDEDSFIKCFEEHKEKSFEVGPRPENFVPYKSLEVCAKGCAEDSGCAGFAYGLVGNHGSFCQYVRDEAKTEKLEDSHRTSYIKKNAPLKGLRSSILH